MRRATFPCALAALLLVGCSRPETPRLDYRRQTNAICAATVQQVRALPQPRSDAELLAVLRRLRAINRRMTERIAVLDAPPGDRPERRQDAVVDIGLRTDKAAQKLIEALSRSGQPQRELDRRRPTLRRAAERADHAWARTRLHACADGPSSALAQVGARTGA
jgi:hypothetical protein